MCVCVCVREREGGREGGGREGRREGGREGEGECVHASLHKCACLCVDVHMSVFDIHTVIPEPLLGVGSIRPITRSFVSSCFMYTDFGT